MPRLPERLSGIVPPVCTPMTESFKVDTDSLARLVEFLIENGVHGLFVLGSTGEAVFLTDVQRAAVLEATVATARGRVPVLAGIIETTTSRCIEQARTAAQIGADGLVLTAPFYVSTNQDEIIEHFRAVHSAVDIPIFAYDVPSCVHTKIEYKTVVRMANEGVILGIKDSSGDQDSFRALLIETRTITNFSAFTGSELLVDVALLMGASGSVPGLANIDPNGYVRIYNAVRAGDLESARREQERLARLYFQIAYAGTPRMSFVSSALGGFKTALMLQGVIATNAVGRPLTRLNQDEVERVRAALVEAGLL